MLIIRKSENESKKESKKEKETLVDIGNKIKPKPIDLIKMGLIEKHKTINTDELIKTIITKVSREFCQYIDQKIKQENNRRLIYLELLIAISMILGFLIIRLF